MTSEKKEGTVITHVWSIEFPSRKRTNTFEKCKRRTHCCRLIRSSKGQTTWKATHFSKLEQLL